MLTIKLPRLVAGRDLADILVDDLDGGGTPVPVLAGASVLVDASELESGTASFAAQLTRRLLVDGNAAQLVLRGAPTSFVEYVRRAAETLDVSARLVVREGRPGA